MMSIPAEAVTATARPRILLQHQHFHSMLGKMRSGGDPTDSRPDHNHRLLFHSFLNGCETKGWRYVSASRQLIRAERVERPICNPVPKLFRSLYSGRKK